jgi:hypothetical protein
VVTRSDDATAAPASACLERALHAARIEGLTRSGLHARRTYVFVNPPNEVVVSQALAVTPPLRGATRPAGADASREPPPAASPIEGLQEADLIATVAAHLADLQACYATVLRAWPYAEGAITLHFTIDADGGVSDVSAADAQPPMDGAARCAVGVLQGLRFPRSARRTVAQYPVSFARRFWRPP